MSLPITRPSRIAVIALVNLLAILSIGSAQSGEEPTKRAPNIVFILTDDQGWPTLGCFGNKLLPTPHLDRLASQGMRLTDAYVMPQCTPTRAALLTGQHTARNRMWHVIPWYGYPWAPVSESPYVESLPRQTFTIAKGLKAAGYATACIGKWHLTNGLDGNYVGLKQEAAHYFGFDFAPAPPSPRYHQVGDKGVRWLTDQAIGFIERNSDKPWFVYLSHHTIHGPVVAPEQTIAKFRASGAPETGLHNATYLAAIQTLDESVGYLLQRLDDLGQSSNTIVVFLSDNGGVFEIYNTDPIIKGPGTVEKLTVGTREFSNAPLRAGKGSPYEGGIRVPCIVRWPGVIKPGSVSQTPTHVVDWLPTLLEAAGAKPSPDNSVDGLSLVPLLKGGRMPDRCLFWYMPLYDLRWGATPCAVIRDGDWKLIHFFGDHIDAGGRYRKGPHTECFNLKQDLSESQNLAEAEHNRALQLRNRLFQWLDSFPGNPPGPNPHFDPAKPLLESRQKQPWNP